VITVDSGTQKVLDNFFAQSRGTPFVEDITTDQIGEVDFVWNIEKTKTKLDVVSFNFMGFKNKLIKKIGNYKNFVEKYNLRQKTAWKDCTWKEIWASFKEYFLTCKQLSFYY
jgi:hypothetical protein